MKKKIIIGATAVLLIIAIVCPLAFSIVNTNEHGNEGTSNTAESTTRYEETTSSTKDSTSGTEIPPIEIPKETAATTKKPDVTLDVTDKERDPNPGIVDATVEYGTKEGVNRAQ